jgi:hypothetical protein
MRRKQRRTGGLEPHAAQLSVAVPHLSRASIRASRLLNTSAATLAASVLTDSTAEHYRAGFHNRAMFIAPTVSAATLATATASAFAPRGHGLLPRAVFAAAVVTGLVGFGFHLTNVSRRVGGWNSANVFHGAPIAAPLGITMAGLLGIAASRIVRSSVSRDDRVPPRPGSRASKAFASLSALGLAGTSIEAGALHFRGAFQNPFMYSPVAIPPIAAVTLSTAAVTGSSRAHSAARAFLRLTGWIGIVGMGFHAWGVHRRMGGWDNWRQNLFAGPPLPAPPAFTGLALAGLAALELLEAERPG